MRSVKDARKKTIELVNKDIDMGQKGFSNDTKEYLEFLHNYYLTLAIGDKDFKWV